jgi:20S proteasome alpha/beta subunit
MTVTQSTTKITQIENDILFASSGPIGLGQQIADAIDADSNHIHLETYHQYAPKGQQKIRALMHPAWVMAAAAAPVIGGAAQADAMCGCLLAATFRDGFKLIEISPQGGWEYLTENIPFVCIGSGKFNADPFLRYLRSVFFQDLSPNLNEAVLAAYWTVQACIDAGTNGVGMGVDVFVLDATGKKPVARQLDEADLAEAKSFVKEAEDAWRDLRDRIRGKGTDASAPPTMDNG